MIQPVCKWVCTQVTAEPWSTTVSKYRDSSAPSPGRAVGRAGSSAITNNWLRLKKQIVFAASLLVSWTFRACFPVQKGTCWMPALLVLCLSEHKAAAFASQYTHWLESRQERKRERKDCTEESFKKNSSMQKFSGFPRFQRVFKKTSI